MSSDSETSGPGDRSTVVVELTPAGRGAVAVVVVAGPLATEYVGRLFTSAGGRPLADVPLRQISVGRWNGPAGEELLVCRRAEDRVEVHCHGGAAAAGAVLADLVKYGCRHMALPGWLTRASRDPISAAARIALMDAPTARAAAILLDQLDGALAAAVLQAHDQAATGAWQLAAVGLDMLLAQSTLGLRLTRPWRVVLAGKPNVGKSSLVNALAGYQRAIVSTMPGTTRDVVTVTTAVDGWPVELADTAGLRAAESSIEAAGVMLAEATIAAADLVVVVHDATDAAVDLATNGSTSSEVVLEGARSSARVIPVWNKIDLVARRPAASDESRATVGASGDEAGPESRNNRGIAIQTSAITGEGIAALLAAIAQTLVPAAPPPGAAVPFTAEQVAILTLARAAIERRDGPAACSMLRQLIAL